MTIVKSKTISQLHKILWKAFSEYIRRKNADRNGYVRCCSCGQIHQWKNVDCGHYISRSFLTVRYDEMNCAPQCKGCNAFRQGNPIEFRKHLIDRYGEKAVLDLEGRKNYPAGFTRDGLILKIEEYKQKLKGLI